MNQAKTPLIVRMPNWIGDCMMALPALYYLEKQGYSLTLISKAWLQQLWPNAWPIITYQKNNTAMLDQIKQHAATTMLLFPNSFSAAWLAKKCGKKAIGYKGNYRNVLLKKKFTKYANLHEANHFLKLAQRFCDDTLNTKALNVYQLPSSAKQALQQQQTALVEQYPVLQQPFILLCPFAVGTNQHGTPKKWPFWEELVQAVQQQYPALNIICCPSHSELAEAQALPTEAVCILEDIDLTAYFCVMQMAQAVVANDTGPAHMAACVNQHVLTLFGATEPKRTCPLTSDSLGVYGKWPSVDEVMGWLVQKL